MTPFLRSKKQAKVEALKCARYRKESKVTNTQLDRGKPGLKKLQQNLTRKRQHGGRRKAGYRLSASRETRGIQGVEKAADRGH